jgi:hypothetical protein
VAHGSGEMDQGLEITWNSHYLANNMSYEHGPVTAGAGNACWC